MIFLKADAILFNSHHKLEEVIKIKRDYPDYKFAWNTQWQVAYSYERWRDSGGISAAEANPKIEQAYI